MRCGGGGGIVAKMRMIRMMCDVEVFVYDR